MRHISKKRVRLRIRLTFFLRHHYKEETKNSHTSWKKNSRLLVTIPSYLTSTCRAAAASAPPAPLPLLISSEDSPLATPIPTPTTPACQPTLLLGTLTLEPELGSGAATGGGGSGGTAWFPRSFACLNRSRSSLGNKQKSTKTTKTYA